MDRDGIVAEPRTSFLQRLQASMLVRRALTLGTGTAIGQALVLLATPLFTRLYGPVELGKLGIFAAFLLPAATIAGLRMEFAIPLARKPMEADRLLAVTLALVPPLSLLLAACFSVLSAIGVLGFDALSPLDGAWMFLVLIAAGTFSALRMWSVARGDFRAISVALVLQGLARAVVPIVISPFVAGWYGLLGGELLGRIIGIRRLFLDARLALRRTWRALSPRRICVAVRRYLHFPLVFTPSSLLDSLVGALPVPITAATLGLDAAGQLLVAQRIIASPATFIGAALGDVVNARFVESARRSREEVRAVVAAVSWRLAAGGVISVTPLALLVAWFAEPVLGDGWHAAGVLAAVLAPYGISGMVTNPVSRALFVSRVPQLKLIADAVRVVLPNLGLLIATQQLESLTLCIALYGVLAALADAFYLGLIWFCVAPHRQRQLV